MINQTDYPTQKKKDPLKLELKRKRKHETSVYDDRLQGQPKHVNLDILNIRPKKILGRSTLIFLY